MEAFFWDFQTGKPAHLPNCNWFGTLRFQRICRSGGYLRPSLGQHFLINNTALAKNLLRVAALLPLSANHRTGAALGWLSHKISSRNRKIVSRNLELCFPQISDSQRSTLAKENLVETGKNISELAPFWFWKKSRVRGLLKEEVGRDNFDRAKAHGKGVIVASPHFGAWELAGLLLSTEAPIHFLYRPNRNSSLDEPVIASRERFGGKCYPISSRGLGKLVRALKQGDAIAILPDQEPGQDHGVFAPFFEVPAYTMTFMTNLARKTGAPVVFTAVERLSEGEGYRMHYLQPHDDLYDEDPIRSATALNQCIEQCIAIAPAQYMWNYKRFRKSPPETASRY